VMISVDVVVNNSVIGIVVGTSEVCTSVSL
jgi:hypothetical protein